MLIRPILCSVNRGVRTDAREAELKAVPRLLAEIDLRGRVVTFDALHTQVKTARQIVKAGGDYFMVVKENQPQLLGDIQLLFDEPPPGEVFAQSLKRGRHGDRREERFLEASASLNGYLKWPHVGQVCRIERKVSRKGQTTAQIGYAVTSLTPERADADRLQRLWRGHWSIENRLHWVRDETMSEDRSQIRTGSAPQVMAALRNTTLGILRHFGVDNVAAALRRHARYPHEALAMMGWPVQPLE
jgi:predicted transposase YbfD/YdcC